MRSAPDPEEPTIPLAMDPEVPGSVQIQRFHIYYIYYTRRTVFVWLVWMESVDDECTVWSDGVVWSSGSGSWAISLLRRRGLVS